MGEQPDKAIHASGAALQLIPDGFGVTYPAGWVTLGVGRTRDELPGPPEMVCNLVARDTARSESAAAGLKCEHQEPSSWSRHGRDSLGVLLALTVGEAVEAAPIDKEFVVLADPERLQASHVTTHPVDIDAARMSALLGCIERTRDTVHARNRPSASSQVNGVATCPAADVQRPTWRSILCAELGEGRGNSVALPRRDAQPVENTVGIHWLNGSCLMRRRVMSLPRWWHTVHTGWMPPPGVEPGFTA
jgi:hypothetical protein